MTITLQSSFHTLSPDPQTETYWAITTDADTDAMMYQPLAGTDNHPVGTTIYAWFNDKFKVFHIEDFGDDVDHSFAFLNMYAVRNGIETEVAILARNRMIKLLQVYASNGLYRGGCAFQFYFPSFRCRPNENLHYEVLSVFVSRVSLHSSSIFATTMASTSSELE